ncbi:uncharacterized protein J3D65DRAFT_633856 [Phyllosticta citribraziliensis]|uniref:Complex I intermediate-associated protein 84 n=1 Tax=Phyllosticta citribraziliensis TaxID=989973 RepID=A0ABR1LGD6_9PEZI
MPTPLARPVLRRLVSSNLALHRKCLYCRIEQSLQQCQRQKLPLEGRHQRRTVFGFPGRFLNVKQQPADVAALALMRSLSDAIKDQARPPHFSEIELAWRKFFTARFERSQPLSDVEARHALDTLRYMIKIWEKQRAQEGSRPAEDAAISGEHLVKALCVVRNPACINSQSYVQLAELIFEQIKSQATEDPESKRRAATAHEFFLHVQLQNGHATLVRDYLVGECAAKDPRTSQSFDPKYWSGSPLILHDVMRHFADAGNETELLRTYQLVKELPGAIQDEREPLEYVLAYFYARKRSPEEMEKWLDIASKKSGLQVIPATLFPEVVRCCLAKEFGSYGRRLVRLTLEKLELSYKKPTNEQPIHLQTDGKAIWDAVLLWAAGNGKGVEEVDRMMQIMARQKSADGWRAKPDVETINMLLEFCASRQDAYSAERYVLLGQKRGIMPNATTYSLQVESRLAQGDIEGARAAYKNLVGEESLKQEDIRAANKMVRALIAHDYDFDAVMYYVDDLNDREAIFEMDTVLALAKLHMKRNELHEVIDLLKTHAAQAPTDERRKVFDFLVSFVFLPQTSTAVAWDIYVLLRGMFSEECLRDTRTDIMKEFFRRGRADISAHIFQQMREDVRAEVQPTVDTYIAALMGATQSEDEEPLSAIHNLLKLDASIDPDTRLHNALMIAYVSRFEPARAWRHWLDIINSTEGPNYTSIIVAFSIAKFMQTSGAEKTKALWERIVNMNIEVTEDLLGAYLDALAGLELIEEALDTLKRSARDFGIKPSPYLLGKLFNAAKPVTEQRNVAAHLQKEHTEEWEALTDEVKGKLLPNGRFLFNIDRKLEP